MALELLYRLLIAVSLLGGEVHAGYAPRYSPGVMERVARVRDLAPVDCMVSSPRYEVGAWIWVYGANTGTLLHCRVTDVSQTRDRARHLRTKREVDLGSIRRSAARLPGHCWRGPRSPATPPCADGAGRR